MNRSEPTKPTVPDKSSDRHHRNRRRLLTFLRLCPYLLNAILLCGCIASDAIKYTTHQKQLNKPTFNVTDPAGVVVPKTKYAFILFYAALS